MYDNKISLFAEAEDILQRSRQAYKANDIISMAVLLRKKLDHKERTLKSAKTRLKNRLADEACL